MRAEFYVRDQLALNPFIVGDSVFTDCPKTVSFILYDRFRDKFGVDPFFYENFAVYYYSSVKLGNIRIRRRVQSINMNPDAE